MRPKGNDASFVYKIKMVHSDSDHLIQKKLDGPTTFGLQHYAGPVYYDAAAFVESNTDRLPPDLLECACRSSNDLIRGEFVKIAEASKQMAGTPRKRGGSSMRQTVVTKFKSQLTQLMKSIESTRTRYIRCIKPNPIMAPGITHHRTTTTQLVCAGLVTAIAISRESFPNRLRYDVMSERFRCLVPSVKDASGARVRHPDLRSEVEHILVTVLFVTDKRDAPYACGKTKVCP